MILFDELKDRWPNFQVGFVKTLMNVAIVAERILDLESFKIFPPLISVSRAPKHENYGIQSTVDPDKTSEVSCSRISSKVRWVLDVGVGLAYGAVPVLHIQLSTM